MTNNLSLTARLQAGDVVEFFEQKRILTGYCLIIKKDRVQVLTETSREMNLPINRILHLTRQPFPLDTPRSDIIPILRRLSKDRDDLANTIDFNGIWEILSTESGEIQLTDFTGLIFNPPVNANQVAAVVRALQFQKIHFHLESEKIITHSSIEVEQFLTKLQQVKEKEQEKDILVQWLNHPEQFETRPFHADRLIKAMKAIAADQEEYCDKQWANGILKRVELTGAHEVFCALVKMGIFDMDENLDLIRYPHFCDYPKNWRQDLDYVQQATQFAGHKRQFLANHKAFTIDGITTRDMDDALSINENADGTCEIGIHITDVAALIPRDCVLDQSARSRTQTLYMPDRILPMFPPEFSEESASLIEGTNRICLSLITRFSSCNYLVDYEIVLGVVPIHKRLTYEDVDLHLNSPDLDRLHKIASALRAERVRFGAIVMPRPELDIQVTESKEIIIKIREREQPSQLIVSEFMVLMNRLCAEYANKNSIPFLYRTQDAPSEPAPKSEGFDPLIAYRQRRLMNRAYSSIEPKPHFSLALKNYTNMTSPLRRYFDLINQRQIEAYLSGTQCYSPDELQMIMYEIDAGFAKSGAIAANREHYWLLKHLATRSGIKLDAVVVDQFPHRYQLWLNDYAIDADLPPTIGRRLTPGESIKVVIDRVAPRERILKLRLVD